MSHSPRPVLVSVVIPTHDRAGLLPDAIASVVQQTHAPIEIIVVDDASTDDTREVVSRLGVDVTYLRHETRRNGAAARNTGARAARGEFVAFLDSDDRWLPDHLERKLAVLRETGAHGVFGSFFLSRRGVLTEYRCAQPPADAEMAEYIMSSTHGDTRTSTFVFEREALLAVMFDEELGKHQDWDLAIRFTDRYRLCCDRASSVVIRADASGRMSACMKHPATDRFLGRHIHRLSLATRARVYANLALRTRRMEGRNAHFHVYRRQAARHWTAAARTDKLLLAGLALPIVDVLALRAIRALVALKRRLHRRGAGGGVLAAALPTTSRDNGGRSASASRAVAGAGRVL